MKLSNYRVYNQTFEGKKNIFFPKKIKEILSILKSFKKKNIKPLVISGSCGHGDKSYNDKSKNIIDLREFNRIIKISYKEGYVVAQPGLKLIKLMNILSKKNFFIYNIPGGKNISLGGAISGNVHGRPQSSIFNTFGDNIIYLKIIDNNLKVRTYNRKSKIFFKIIGSLGLKGIILEAGIKIFKNKNSSFYKHNVRITGLKNFYNFDYSKNTYYGFINYFDLKKFDGHFTYFESDLKKTKKIKKEFYYIFKVLNFLKIDKFISFFINQFSLRILYFVLFNFLEKNTKIKKILFKDSIYFVDINTYLPFYFKKGMIEIQFSIKKNNLLSVIKLIQKLQLKEKVFPSFFILKKMYPQKNNYFFKFPRYSHCISLGYSKQQYQENKSFFVSLYKILNNKHCNYYLTKDETILDSNLSFKKKLKFGLKPNNTNNNNFFEKLFSE